MLAKRCLLTFALLCSLVVLPAAAQVNTTTHRVTDAVNNAKLVVLGGTVHPLARPQYDRGVAPASLPMNHMLLVLKPSPERQAALESLLAEQQDPNSPNYHKWITPEEFGSQFGASDQNIQTITSWLESQGFTVNNVSNGRTVIDFSGTAAAVQAAFHTAIHRYVLPDGKEHWANSTDIEIPAALASVVAGIRSLNNFFPRPLHHAAVRPAFTYNFGAPCSSSTNNNCYDVTPADFNTIYNVPATATGAGETIAIVSDSDVVASDLAQFRSLFGLPAMTAIGPTDSTPSCTVGTPCFVQFVPPGQTDPNVQPSGNESEAILDVEWAGSTAPATNIWLVSSQDSGATFGGDLSATYIVNCDSLNPSYASECTIPNAVAVPAQVLSYSYGLCESSLGGSTFYSTLWQQAEAEGITVVVAAGDAGSAACDSQAYTGSTPQSATQGLAVNGAASTPYDVAVGGTDFDQSSNPSQFWSATNSSTGESVLGYIPETTWNDSCTNSIFGNDPIGDCNNANNSGFVFTLGAGGGPSTCGPNCSAGYPKPCWQMATLTAPCARPGAVTPADGVRDIPDISFFAGNGFNGSSYIVCEADTPAGSPSGQAGTQCSLETPPANNVTQSSFEEVGGTSVAAQAFAGIAALIDQEGGGTGQGNIDQYLYNIAGQAGSTCTSAASPASTCVFYDVNTGTISQPCAYGTTPSPNCVGASGDQYGALGTGSSSSFSPSYDAGPGYDYATGLGSINVSNLFCKAAALTCTTTALQGAPTTITFGQSTMLTATVAPQAGSGTPTGAVNFFDGSASLNSTPVALVAGVATYSTTSLAVGAHSITAAYGGDSNFAASTSSPVQVQVNAAPSPDFSVSATPSSQSVTPGQSTSYTLTVTPQNGFNQAVTISCSGAPAESTCSAASSPITLNGTTAQQVTINVTTTAASLVAPITRPFSGWRTPAILAAFMLLCLILADRFNRQSIAARRWLAGATCATAIAFAVLGCGGGNGTPKVPGSLSAPTITPASGSYSSPQNVTIAASAGATVCYTTNGAAPSATTAGTCAAGSTQYSGGFSLAIPSGGATVEAIATEAGFTNSAVSTNHYTAAGTAAGTYTLTITGTSGSTVHTTTVSLVVQ